MERTGFDVAVLRADQNIDFAQRQFDRYRGFYQGDAVHRVAAASPDRKRERGMSSGNFHLQRNRFAVQVQPAGSAIARNAAPSGELHSQAGRSAKACSPSGSPIRWGRRRSATRRPPASGAEDVVISHLISSLKLDIGIFVLETGRPAPGNPGLAGALARASTAALQSTVYQPVNESRDAVCGPRTARTRCTRASPCARPAAASARCEPLERALKGKDAWITGLRREQSGARAEVPLVDTQREAHQDQPSGQLDLGRCLALHPRRTSWTTTHCTTSSSPASAASLAPAPSAWVKTSAPAAGGGKTKPPRNAACT